MSANILKSCRKHEYVPRIPELPIKGVKTTDVPKQCARNASENHHTFMLSPEVNKVFLWKILGSEKPSVSDRFSVEKHGA